MKIAFFDSGIGGLTVLHQARLLLPQAEYLYYADTDHVPYGEKTREEIMALTDQAVSFLLAEGADAIVLACNTATAAAIATLRQKYAAPILGMEPAVKPAVAEVGADQRVLVLATPLTLREEKLANLLAAVDEAGQVDLLAMPQLVCFAERGEFVSPAVDAYLAECLAPFLLSQYAIVVLGCTHFNYFKDSLRRILPASTRMVDGSAGTVKHLIEVLAAKGSLAGEKTTLAAPVFYCSGRKLSKPGKLAAIEQLFARLDQMLLL